MAEQDEKVVISLMVLVLAIALPIWLGYYKSHHTVTVTSHCDLMVDTVCFDHTDGAGHVKTMTEEEKKKVKEALAH